MDERLSWKVPSGSGGRLDRALARAFPAHSRARIQAWIEGGRVTVDGAPARASARVLVGQLVEVDVPPVAPSRAAAESLDVPVLYEDEDLAVVVKPAGMVVHPSAGHQTGTLVNALLGQLSQLSGIGGEERPGIVHRLDVGTSGVMVVAKNDIAHRALAADFATHRLERRYLAVVHRVPLHDAGTERSLLARDPANRLRIMSVPEHAPVVDADGDEPEVKRWGWRETDFEEEEEEEATPRRGGRIAVTHWRVLARGDRVALVTCLLETGRTHQVRVHLSERGHPIVGDRVYGRRDCVAPAALRARADALTRPLLHAFRLGIYHPRDGRWMSWDATPPADFLAFCAAAGLAIPALPPSSPK